MSAQVNDILQPLAADFFAAANLDAHTKRDIFSAILIGIKNHESELLKLAVDEVKLTNIDAQREIDRACKTFEMAAKHADYISQSTINLKDKIIHEKRVARGPLLAITPFSSPLSSPAHKISMGLLAGTSVLFKPSPLAQNCGQALYDIIKKACAGKYVYFSTENNQQMLTAMVADDRIGIISFTGGYKTGKNIIKNGGVKRYHMELTGGNSPVLFAPKFGRYDDQLVERLFEGIIAKNGERCVSIKHIFLPVERKDFARQLHMRLLDLKVQTKSDLQTSQPPRLGPLISSDYAKKSVHSVRSIVHTAKEVESYIKLERDGAYIFPTMYAIPKIDPEFIRQALNHDLPGPVVFIHFYSQRAEYEKILKTFKNDYVRSGLQLSIYVTDQESALIAAKDLLWGGIIFNDIPTFRDDMMSFGGFGKAGLGKEGFFETINAYTDPQTIVLPRSFPPI